MDTATARPRSPVYSVGGIGASAWGPPPLDCGVAADHQRIAAGGGAQADWRVRTGGAAPFRHIRSAILKMSQPRKASPNSQKSDTAITVPHPRFLQGVYDFTGRNASNNFTELIACASFMTSAYD
jgi:hypothetical protein